MQPITFVTGNPGKAAYLAKYLGFPIEHIKLDLDELQSLSLEEIVEHKVRQAYERVQKPVLVEDASLTLSALGGLPGPFIKFFIEELGLQGICDLLGDRDRHAVAATVYGYYDGHDMRLFRSSHAGTIALGPRGEHGYGWDQIYEPIGYGGLTRAELDEADDAKNYLQIKPLEQVREFLMQL